MPYFVIQLNGLDNRETLCKELGISETEVNKNTPLLLELVKRGGHKDKTSVFTEVIFDALHLSQSN